MSTSDAARPSIFVSSSRFERVNLERALPASAKVRVVYNESGKRLSEDQIIGQRPPNCVAIIAGLEQLSRHVLEQFPDLKVIARLGTGMDSVDVAAARERSVAVIGTPDATTDAVAELTLGMMISALRGVTNADQGIRSGAWTPVQGGLVKGSVVIECRVEGDDVAEAIDTGAAPDHGTSRDAFLTMSLVDSIYYAHEQWRARHSIPNPKNYTL